jgi:superfamily II DNA/RNA helicase
MLSSDLAAEKREKVMAAFRAGEIRHLVTTDVASRGIDIEDLSHVFIFSTPTRPSSTSTAPAAPGRVGKSGRAISLLSAHDLMNFNRLVKRYHVEVTELHGAVRRGRQRGRWSASSRAWRPRPDAAARDFVELGPIARRSRSTTHRDRMVALAAAEVLRSARARARGAGVPRRPPERRREGPHRRGRRRR